MIIILSLEDTVYVKYVLYLANDLESCWELIKKDALVAPYRMEMNMRMFEPTEDMMRINKLSLLVSDGEAKKENLKGFSARLLDTVYSFYRVAETEDEIAAVLSEAEDLASKAYASPIKDVFPDLIDELKRGIETERNTYHIATYKK